MKFFIRRKWSKSSTIWHSVRAINLRRKGIKAHLTACHARVQTDRFPNAVVFSLYVSAHRPIPTAMPEFRTVWTNPFYLENPYQSFCQCEHRCYTGATSVTEAYDNTTLTLYKNYYINIFYT